MLVIPTQSRRFELWLDACGQPVVRLAAIIPETAARRLPLRAAHFAPAVGRPGRLFSRLQALRDSPPLVDVGL